MNILSRGLIICMSVCGGGFAAHAQADIFSYIISESEKKPVKTDASNNGNDGFLGALSEVENGGRRESSALTEALAVAADPYGIGAALSAISGDASSHDENGLSSVSSLNYITMAYSVNGFYQNGFMGQTPVYNNFTSHPGHQGTIYTPEWGRITSGFGYRARFQRMHKGIDIAMSVGDTVRSALPGVVEKVNYESRGYGHYVVVRHDNGMETRYAHLTKSLVSPGQSVSAGQPIALSGNTGKTTGPHLHFETRYLGSAVDPRTVFDFSSTYMNGYAQMVSEKKTKQYNGLATGFNGAKTSLQSKSTYVVRQDDTVKKIAKRAGISPLRLCQLNFITEDASLQPGTMLKLK